MTTQEIAERSAALGGELQVLIRLPAHLASNCLDVKVDWMLDFSMSRQLSSIFLMPEQS